MKKLCIIILHRKQEQNINNKIIELWKEQNFTLKHYNCM